MGGVSGRLRLVCALAISSAAPPGPATLTTNYDIISNAVTVQGFDIGLGELTGVNIAFSGQLTAGIRANNTTSEQKTFNSLMYSVPISISAPGLPVQTFTSGPWTGTSLPGILDFAVGGNFSGSLDIPSSALGAYQSGAPLNWLVTFGIASLSGVPSGVTMEPEQPHVIFGLFGPGLTVTYTYNEVPVATTPLPAALPLFASGLAALGLIGMRRRESRPHA